MQPDQPTNQSSQSPQPKLSASAAKFVVLQQDEQVICEIKRHPIGLIGMYSTGILVLVIVLAAAVVAPQYVAMTQQTKLALFLGALIVMALTLLFTYIGKFVYTANRWIVTTDSITQVTQLGLFNTQTSQLSMANLEDVTVGQNTLLQQMFGYGTLQVESAGVRDKFQFPFCPQPNDYARKIIAAHEAYIADKPREMVTTNRPLATTNSFNQPPSVPNQDWPGRPESK